MVERQLNLVLQALALQTAATRYTEGPLVAVSPEAYRLDDRRTQRLMAGTAWVAGCRSWYKTASGRVTNNWPTWTVRYWYDTLHLRSSELGIVAPARAGADPTAARSVARPDAADGRARAEPTDPVRPPGRQPVHGTRLRPPAALGAGGSAAADPDLIPRGSSSSQVREKRNGTVAFCDRGSVLCVNGTVPF